MKLLPVKEHRRLKSRAERGVQPCSKSTHQDSDSKQFTMATTGFIALIFAVQAIMSWGEERVEQPSGEMSASEEDSVNIECKYNTSFTNAYLFWYKQLPNRSPEFILNEFTVGKGDTEPEYKERFSAELNPASKTVPLLIQNVRVSDSAAYYCALRPTEMRAHTTFIQKQSQHSE
ncbi:hypothetical protein DNTS_029941 [Danionella cerebrum]|uniref:Ig-like domain-containing protein n=1 Tax=Danionella cerebrum TaxID=2873325 RepID=A0A553RQ07_9TELE|nr:hypothetical protein DNTS_029941 [Danionella translucida]